MLPVRAYPENSFPSRYFPAYYDPIRLMECVAEGSLSANMTLSLSQDFTGIARAGRALSFNGVNQEAYINNATAYNVGSGSFGIMCWMKINGTSSGGNYQHLICKRSTGYIYLPGYQLSYNYSSRCIYFSTADGTNYTAFLSPSYQLNLGQWYHIAGVHDKTTGYDYIYIDGILRASASNTSIGNIDNSSIDLTFGGVKIHINPTIYQNINGCLDDIRFYNYALSQSEIQSAMYTEATGNETGLVGYWKFNEGSGLIAYNSVSGGQNGTLYNSPTWVDGVPGLTRSLTAQASLSVGTICSLSAISAAELLASGILSVGDIKYLSTTVLTELLASGVLSKSVNLYQAISAELSTRMFLSKDNDAQTGLITRY